MSLNIFVEAELAQSIAGARGWGELLDLVNTAINNKTRIRNYELLMDTAVAKLESFVCRLPNFPAAKMTVKLGVHAIAYIHFRSDEQAEKSQMVLISTSADDGTTQLNKSAMLETIAKFLTVNIINSATELTFDLEYQLTQEA